MSASLALAALLMGLAGTPHCLAMCGASSVGVVRVLRGPAPAGTPLSIRPAAPLAQDLLWLQLGRLAGYALAGALAALSVQGLGEAGTRSAALRPLWHLLHAGIAAWGLVLLVAGRQPLWAARAGHALVARAHAGGTGAARLLLAGAAWVLLPCGLLYSALMLAALASHPAESAALMALFALASSPGLVAGPWAWARWRPAGRLIGQVAGTRIAGALLVLLSVQALGLDLGTRIAAWCA